MKKWKWIVLVLATTLCIGSASAHPGRTDANGGHYDHSTGEYHYHHGYPAHQHIDGVCPYDYDDRTGWNSGSGSQEQGLYYLDGTPVERKNETKPKPEPEPKKSQIGGIIALCAFGGIFIVYPLISTAISGISWYLERRKRRK